MLFLLCQSDFQYWSIISLKPNSNGNESYYLFFLLPHCEAKAYTENKQLVSCCFLQEQ